MEKIKMLTGFNYTGEEVKRAKAIIERLGLNIKIEQDLENEIAYAVGNKEEIKQLFAEATKK